MPVDELDDFEPVGLPPFVWDPIGVVRRRWRWMLVILVLGLAGAALLGVALKARYRAQATVMVATKEIPEEFVRSTVRGDPFERINAMVGEILAHPHLASLIVEHELFPELRESVPMAELVTRMRADITIDTDRGIGTPSQFQTAQLLTIAFESERPGVSAAVANSLAAQLTEVAIRLRSRQAALTTEFMTRELKRAERELREHDQKITDFKTRYRGELPADLEPSLQMLARLQEQRQSLALQIAETESRMTVLSTDDTSPDARLVRLRADLTEQLAIRTDKHPDVVDLKRRVASLEREIGPIDEGGSDSGPPRTALLMASRQTLEELKRQRAEAAARIRDLEQRVARIPERQEELGALEQKESVLQATYTDFLRKVQEAELAQSLEQAQQGARVAILERAEPPLRPTRSRRKIVGLGVIAAVFAACGVGILLELADPVIVIASDTHSVEDVPILGSVPWIS